MRKTQLINRDWEIKSFSPAEQLDSAWKRALNADGEWLKTDVPKAVQEVLWAYGRLDQSVLETGEAESCKWVSDLDWAFRTTFDAERDLRTFLRFKGLDTYADIVVNGQLMARHASLYKPLLVEITGALQAQNELLVYFHSPFAILPELEKHRPAEHAGKIGPFGLMRKAIDDLSAHAGVMPYFAPIGIYDDVELITAPRAWLQYNDVDVSFSQHRTQAFVHLHAEVDYACGYECARLHAVLYAPDGTEASRSESAPSHSPEVRLIVDEPQLWWPRNYGDQPLYRLHTELWVEGRLADVDERSIGLREIREGRPLEFFVNGVSVRLWGSCMVPMWGATHEYQEERARTLLDLAEAANMNALRFWGPAQQYSDRLYDELDRRGILVWQDFSTSGTHMSEDPEFVACVVSEAEMLVKRLKHHPCILLWCGGNESVYMCDLFDPQAEHRIGHELIYKDLRQVAFRLDPRRTYRVSSPYGGAYANDTTVDSHGSRASLSYLPGETYSNFFSENIRTCLPEYKSIRRFIPEDQLWPSDWTDRAPFGCTEFLPPAWQRRTMNHWAEKTGPFERFYDADRPEELVYKFNAAAAYDLRMILNASRRGKEYAQAHNERRTHGHLLWKLTTSWPQMYCALIDYYLEPGQPYYALRRAYAPVQATVDVQDHVYIWGVNDTQKSFTGTAHLRIYDIEKECDVILQEHPVSILAGESRILLNLDAVGQFTFTSVVEVRLLSADGTEISRDVQYMKPERYLPFPDAQIELSCLEDGRIKLSSERFVRCVELTGEEDGDAFGWYFEDNWFDLLPGEPRIISIGGRHDAGTISARGHYSSCSTSVEWNRGT